MLAVTAIAAAAVVTVAVLAHGASRESGAGSAQPTSVAALAPDWLAATLLIAWPSAVVALVEAFSDPTGVQPSTAYRIASAVLTTALIGLTGIWLSRPSKPGPGDSAPANPRPLGA